MGVGNELFVRRATKYLKKSYSKFISNRAANFSVTTVDLVQPPINLLVDSWEMITRQPELTDEARESLSDAIIATIKERIR